MESQLFSPSAAIEAQKKYCADNRLPLFAPHDGICNRCTNNIYRRKVSGTDQTGISVEKASTAHVLDCPHCRLSYCN